MTTDNGHIWRNDDKGVKKCGNAGCSVRAMSAAATHHWQAKDRAPWRDITRDPLPPCSGTSPFLANAAVAAAVRTLAQHGVTGAEVERWLAAEAIYIQRIHALDGDHDDLGWYARGHYEEQAFRDAVEAYHWRGVAAGRGRVRFKHPSEAEESECRFIQEWWRVSAGRFRRALPGSPGAFAVTALVTSNAEF